MDVSGAQGLSLIDWYLALGQLEWLYSGLERENLMREEGWLGCVDLLDCTRRGNDEPLARPSKLSQDGFFKNVFYLVK